MKHGVEWDWTMVEDGHWMPFMKPPLGITMISAGGRFVNTVQIPFYFSAKFETWHHRADERLGNFPPR